MHWLDAEADRFLSLSLQVLRYFDYVFTGVFTFEMLIKVRQESTTSSRGVEKPSPNEDLTIFIAVSFPPHHPLLFPPADGGSGVGLAPGLLFPGLVEHP